MELQKLIYTVEDGIATIAMNFPKNLNAIDEQMADELMYVVDAAEKDPAVKVVVIKSLGKAFSAGGDIGYFYKLIQAGGEVNMDGLISKVGRRRRQPRTRRRLHDLRRQRKVHPRIR